MNSHERTPPLTDNFPNNEMGLPEPSVFRSGRFGGYCLFTRPSSQSSHPLSLLGLLRLWANQASTLTRPAGRRENVNMRASRALVLIAMLAVQSVCVFGASYFFAPDPIGEKVYHAHLHEHLLSEILPIAIIASAFLLPWLFHVAQRKAKKLAPEDGSYEI